MDRTYIHNNQSPALPTNRGLGVNGNDNQKCDSDTDIHPEDEIGLDDDADSSDDSTDEDPLEEDFGKAYSGPKLGDEEAAKLLILMEHASTCPGRYVVFCRIIFVLLNAILFFSVIDIFYQTTSPVPLFPRHKSSAHAQLCNSVKYMMLHVRDCPGITTCSGDVCPFPWCRKVKHLLYHLVSCVKQDTCKVCRPTNNSKNMLNLTNLNKFRRKMKQDQMKKNIATEKSNSSKRTHSMHTGMMQTNTSKLPPNSTPSFIPNKHLGSASAGAKGPINATMRQPNQPKVSASNPNNGPLTYRPPPHLAVSKSVSNAPPVTTHSNAPYIQNNKVVPRPVPSNNKVSFNPKTKKPQVAFPAVNRYTPTTPSGPNSFVKSNPAEIQPRPPGNIAASAENSTRNEPSSNTSHWDSVISAHSLKPVSSNPSNNNRQASHHVAFHSTVKNNAIDMNLIKRTEMSFKTRNDATPDINLSAVVKPGDPITQNGKEKPASLSSSVPIAATVHKAAAQNTLLSNSSQTTTGGISSTNTISHTSILKPQQNTLVNKTGNQFQITMQALSTHAKENELVQNPITNAKDSNPPSTSNPLAHTATNSVVNTPVYGLNQTDQNSVNLVSSKSSHESISDQHMINDPLSSSPSIIPEVRSMDFDMLSSDCKEHLNDDDNDNPDAQSHTITQNNEFTSDLPRLPEVKSMDFDVLSSKPTSSSHTNDIPDPSTTHNSVQPENSSFVTSEVSNEHTFEIKEIDNLAPSEVKNGDKNLSLSATSNMLPSTSISSHVPATNNKPAQLV